MKFQKYLLPPHPKWLYFLAFPLVVVGLFLTGVGYLICLVGAILILRMLSVIYGLLLCVVGAPIVEFGKFLFIKGRKFLSIKSEHELIHSFQPQILYLRSFRSDVETGRIISTGYQLNLANFMRLPRISATTEEQLLFNFFRKVGALLQLVDRKKNCLKLAFQEYILMRTGKK